jgi:hypothetical protein
MLHQRQKRRWTAGPYWAAGISLLAGCLSLPPTARGEERSAVDVAALRDIIAGTTQSHQPAENDRGTAEIAALRDIIAGPSLPNLPGQEPAVAEPASEELPAPRELTTYPDSPANESSTARDVDALPLRRPPPDAGEILQPELSLDHAPPWDEEPVIATPWQVPSGFAGPSGIAPFEHQEDGHFVPVPDRWRIGLPAWDRYGPDHSVHEPEDPFEEDAPYVRGWIRNPYRQNVVKGDYPIIGQHTFLNVTATSFSDIEFRQVPTATTPFESTPDPGQEDFFGDPDQFFFSHDLKLSFEMFHGDAGFKPFDWRARITPVFNVNYLDVEELAVVSPDVRRGTHRFRNYETIEEWFIESKLLDTSPYYDFTSMRVGSQPFVSDFRGFIFADINRSARLFGTRNANRDQFNLIVFDQREKETNSGLNSFSDDRDQNVLIGNYYRQDFIWPGYTAQMSVHYNHDRGEGLVFDRNGFLVRPDPVGVFQPHTVDAVYFGLAGDGHINRYNISNAFYYVTGHDDLNPLAGQEVDISAFMAAAEISYDRDWVRFRTSVFWASGDDDISDDEGNGFDAIFDNPNFAGGEFSYWQRQSIKLLGVNLVDRFSLVPHLRSSKIQGQTNFVNPGLFLLNFGSDAELTPRLRLIGNVNLLWFDDTEVIEQFVFQSDIDHHIGTDLSLGFERRPLLNDNLIFVGGVSTLIPGDGFEDIYNPISGNVDELFATFLQVTATY